MENNMANHRLIRPGLFVNPGVSTLKIRERYLLIGLTSVANDWGKFWYQANHIRSQVFPTDEIGIDEINEMLDNIVIRDFICVYESKGVKYAHFPSWRTQGSFVMQYLNKPRPDVDIPNCEKHNNDTVGEILSKFSESSGTIERNRKLVNFIKRFEQFFFIKFYFHKNFIVIFVFKNFLFRHSILGNFIASYS